MMRMMMKIVTLMQQTMQIFFYNHNSQTTITYLQKLLKTTK